MEVAIPELWFPAFKVLRGQLCDQWIGFATVTIPPFDITFWDRFKITDKIVLFDTDDITAPIRTFIAGVPEAVFNFAKTALDKMTGEYYEETEEQIVYEKEEAY